MIDNDSISNLERLHKLKADGIITDADFETAKKKLLEGQGPALKGSLASNAPIADDNWLGWSMLPFRKYADFNGRSSRKEFWMFMLLGLIVMVGLAIVIDSDEYGSLGTLGKALLGLCVIGTIVPTTAVMARRYHDQDKSGWYVLLNLIPYIGTVIVFLTMLIDGTPGDNRYGPSPKA